MGHITLLALFQYLNILSILIIITLILALSSFHSASPLLPPLLLRLAQIPDRANLSFPPNIPCSRGPAPGWPKLRKQNWGGWEVGEMEEDGLACPRHPVQQLPALPRAGKEVDQLP